LLCTSTVGVGVIIHDDVAGPVLLTRKEGEKGGKKKKKRGGAPLRNPISSCLYGISCAPAR